MSPTSLRVQTLPKRDRFLTLQHQSVMGRKDRTPHNLHYCGPTSIRRYPRNSFVRRLGEAP
jgi:hypothetical protein